MTDNSTDAGMAADGPHSSGPHRAATVARTDVVWDVLRATLAELESEAPLTIVDAGGGTGGAAVPLAELGHDVTVVEPNPDSLAALERRAAEAGVRVRALQGETRDLTTLLPVGQAHLVLVHNVVEYVEDPLRALRDVVGITRPGGAVSLLAANAVAGALHRALAGHLEEARRLLGDAEGRWGDGDPMPRRFTPEQLHAMTEQVGLTAPTVQGVRIFADLLPGRVFDTDQRVGAQLVELEKVAAEHPALSGIATQLHVVAHRPQ